MFSRGKWCLRFKGIWKKVEMQFHYHCHQRSSRNHHIMILYKNPYKKERYDLRSPNSIVHCLCENCYLASLIYYKAFLMTMHSISAFMALISDTENVSLCIVCSVKRNNFSEYIVFCWNESFCDPSVCNPSPCFSMLH